MKRVGRLAAGVVVLVLAWAAVPVAQAQSGVVQAKLVAAVPAFPGAAGFGATTPGGRGGRIIEVTSLADSGPGSLRAALEADGRRIVVVRVAGTITITKPIVIRSPFITVAGQTAPGGGVTLRGGPILVRTHDVVLRFLRIRPGVRSPVNPEVLDGITLLDTDSNAVHHVVIDHVSATWAVDENMGAWDGPRDVTVQWSLLGEGLAHATHLKDNNTCCDIHSMGFLIGPGAARLSLHHNLFAHNNGRNPHLLGGVQAEIVNNVVYDWGYAGTEIEPLRGQSRVDIIGNHYIPGATSYPQPRGITVFGPSNGARMFVRDNLGPKRTTGSEPQWALVQLDRVSLSDIRSAGRVSGGSGLVPQPVATVSGSVLPVVGATVPVRDSIDARIVASVTDRTGGLIDAPKDVGGYVSFAPATPPPDSDHDGMPNAWEDARGLDRTDPSDGRDDDDLDGYTNVEEYLNELAAGA